MTEIQEWDEHGRHLTLWSVSAASRVLQSPDYAYELMLRAPIKDPAAEVATTRNIEEVKVQGLDRAIAAAHELLDKHAHQVGEFGFEIYLIPPQPPHPDEERFGIRHYKVSAEARKQARALRLRGNLELRLSRLVRYAVPFEHKIANLRFRGIALRVDGNMINRVGLVIPPRRRRRRKAK